MSIHVDSRLWTAALLGSAMVLISCGGGGGGGGASQNAVVSGNGAAPSTGPGDTSSYFPIGATDNWLFDYTTSDPSAPAPSGTVAVSVSGTKTIKGTTATVYSRSDSAGPAGNYDQYFAVSNGGVTSLGNSDPGDTISPLIIPYVQLLFPVALGRVSQVTAQNLPYGTDSSGHAITIDLTQTIDNVTMETVDVPAGTFANALKQSTSIIATARGSAQSTSITGSDTSWYAAGTGLIRDQSSATGAGQTVTSSGELRYSMVNGKARGIGPTGAVGAALVTSGCEGSSHPSPSVSSDGTNFLVVAFSCSTSSGSALSNWVAVLIGPDGTALRTVNLTAPAAVSGTQPYLHAVSAFDGSHYLVVYEGVSTSYTTLPLQSVVLGADGSVTAGPTTVGTAAVATSDSAADREALAFDGTRFLLIYPEGGGAVGTLESVSGIFVAPGTGQTVGTAFVISDAQGGLHGAPAIGFDGTNYLVAWVDSGISTQGLLARRVSTAGVLLDPAPTVLVDLSTTVLNEACCNLEPTVSFDGVNYLVAYRDPRGAVGSGGNGYASVSAARVSASGAMLDGSATSPGIVVAGSKSIPRGRVRSVYTSGAHWLVWETNSPNQLNATRVTPGGVAASAWTDGFTMVPATDITELPALAESSGGPLLVWLRRPSNTAYQSQLVGLRIYP